MQRLFRLDPYRSLIGQWFADCPSLQAQQVHERLKSRGVAVGARTVARFTRPFRRKPKPIFHALEFLPGEEGQVDWFFVTLPVLGKLCGFALILSYSRLLFAQLFPRSQLEFFLQGHLDAFAAFGGCPRTLVYDNLKSVVLRRQPLTYNPSFLSFAHHYRFAIRLCNPAAGNEKGRIERAIRTLKETFFNTLTATSLPGANEALTEWLITKNETAPRTTQKRPVDLWTEEKLLPLPEIPYRNVTVHPPALPSKTGLLAFDTNAYSVPEYLVGSPLSVHSAVAQIKIYNGDKLVASHPRSFERHKTFLNPVHRSFSRISSTAKRERIFRVIQHLDPVVEQFLAQNQGVGEDPYQTAYAIFRRLNLQSRALLLSAIRECVSQRSPRLRSLVTLLEPRGSEDLESVAPQQTKLLDLTYTPRPLEEYDPLP